MLRSLVAFFAILLFAACAGTVNTDPAPDSLTIEQALAQLDALRPEPGADPQSFAQLKEAMRRGLLAADVTRFTSATPSGAAGGVGDLQFAVDGSETSLVWTYANRADYDQNRQVNIADLSTLGAHIGKGTSSSDWLDKARVADGDLNGLVTISDITPIGASLLATVDGYWVQSSTTPSQADSWSDIEQVAFEDSVLEPGNPFKRFAFVLDSPQPGTFYRVRPYNGEELGPVSNYVDLDSGPPSITDVQPQAGVAGTVVQFTPTLSGSPPDEYAWDFGGGAVPNTTIDPAPTVTLGAVGSYSASLTVTGALGSDTFDFTLDVSAGVAPPQIDDVQPQTGFAGGGHITFTATLSGGAPDTYAWDFGAPGGEVSPNTSSEASPEVILGPEGNYNASLTVGNAGGTDTFNFVLSVVPFPIAPEPPLNLRATDGTYFDHIALTWEANPFGGPADDYEIFRAASETGSYTSIGTTSALTFDDDTAPPDAPQWYYVVARTVSAGDSQPSDSDSGYSFNGSTGTWHLQSVPGVSDDQATFCRLVDCNGKPAICRRGSNPFYYAQWLKAQNAEGTTWDLPAEISGAMTGDFSDLAIVGEKPAVLLNNQFGIPNAAFYQPANDQDGATWASAVQCWNVPLDGEPRLLEVNDRPSFTFGTGPLLYLQATDPEGQQWPGTAATVHQHAQPGANLTVLSDGRPATWVSWVQGGSTYYSEFATGLDLLGSSWGNAGIISDPLGSENFYVNSVLVAGGRPWAGLIHYSGALTDLGVLFAEDDAGSSWDEQAVQPAGITERSDQFFAVINDRPCVLETYMVLPGQYEIIYIEATDPQATGWNVPEILFDGPSIAYPCLCGIGVPQRPAMVAMLGIGGVWGLAFAEKY